jgi:DNA-binding CsgD family transcriptional regulator/PAS domain-containing protein
MPLDEHVLDMIDALYEAALDETQWHGVLHKLADFTGSQAATFWVLDGSDQPRLPTFSYVNLDPQLIEEYLDSMAQHDPTVQYLVRNPALPIVHDSMFITEREKDRHRYYDWHHRYSDTRFRLVSRMSPAPAVQVGVALLRARSAGCFEASDVEQFAALHRHIERALALGFKLGSLGTLQQCCTDMLDGNPAAILLLDAQQRVVYANPAADQLCSKNDGLSLSHTGLTAACSQDTDRLRKLIMRAVPNRTRGALPEGGVVPVQRPSGKRPYLVLVAPLSGRHQALSALRPAMSIVISDPHSRPLIGTERLQAAFDLTTAEARLAAALAAGDDLKAVADRLGIRYSTARARLAEIFRKTATRRQGELVSLLLRSPPL